jgi:uncharacterized protein (TIGR03000 family)
MKKFVVLAAFGLVALFVAAPAPADAKHIVRYHGWGHRYFRGDWRTHYYYGHASPSYYYYYPLEAYYPQAEPVDVDTATIRMQVPEGARIWFNGKATSQTGAVRAFETASLAPGRDYVYHVRVRWGENGETVERNRDVTVHAGDQIRLTVDK